MAVQSRALSPSVVTLVTPQSLDVTSGVDGLKSQATVTSVLNQGTHEPSLHVASTLLAAADCGAAMATIAAMIPASTATRFTTYQPRRGVVSRISNRSSEPLTIATRSSVPAAIRRRLPLVESALWATVSGAVAAVRTILAGAVVGGATASGAVLGSATGGAALCAGARW